ncbi:hypothetical protein DIT72_00865 [Marinobacter orientalis]|uniref:Porin n=2 Tax=Marinobacter orientalis TaxID=1928859 RepID=A0A7Y0RDT3_9GAMM|nr:hypothetical protein [Marinobacter orientalis]TGX50634.1 hypothetical protein DIT72_00865 [Marinobacter orientalis]
MLCTSTVMAQESAGYRMEDIEDRIADLENTIPLRVGVGVETLYIYADHDESSRDKVGTYFLDKFELIVSGEWDNGLYYNSRWDYQVTQQAFFPAWTYVGLNHNEAWSTEVGVIIQPLGAGVDGSYYDNSFLSDVPLWIGLANNPDLGIKTQYQQNNWHWVASFTKNTELSGDNPNARFRPDVIAQGEINPRGFANETFSADVEPINTFHGGGAYTFDLDGNATLQLGSNGQFGDYYNTRTNDDGGDHWAATVFANYRSGGFAFTVQGLAYDHNVENAPGVNQTEDSIALSTGALIPSDGQAYSTRISYSMPTSLGIFENVKFYHDYDFLKSGSEDMFTSEDTQFSIAGVQLSRGAFNTWVSVLTSKNANFANGGPAQNDDEWHTQFTVVGALYF